MQIDSFLIDWSVRYLENKDFIRKRIEDIKKNKNESNFIIYYKDKVKYFTLKTNLDEDIFNILKNDEHFGIITLNTSSNISFVVNKWEKLIKFKFLSIYFINPYSKHDKVWILVPDVHDKICDKTYLEQGIKSMSEMVERIDYNELEQKLKSKTEESVL